MKDRSKDCLIFNGVIPYNADGKQAAYLALPLKMLEQYKVLAHR